MSYQSPSKRNKVDSSGGSDILFGSPQNQRHEIFPNTPKSFEFNMLMDQSPSLSVIMSPPLSVFQSSQFPSSRDWSPSMRNLSSMPDNFSFPDTISPQFNRQENRIFHDNNSDKNSNHALDDISQNHLLNNRKALADRLNNVGGSSNSKIKKSNKSTKLGELTYKMEEPASSSSSSSSITLQNSLESLFNHPDFNGGSVMSNEIMGLSGLAAITAAAESFESIPLVNDTSIASLTSLKKRPSAANTIDFQQRDQQFLAQAQNSEQINKTTTCNCRKSKCLKMYCDCFRLKQYCQTGCNCNECANVEIREAERLSAIFSIMERNPEAFKPRVTDDPTSNAKSHLTGCHCRKSSCLKKYCECFTGNVPCMDRCRCIDCKNAGDVYHPDFRFQLLIKKTDSSQLV